MCHLMGFQPTAAQKTEILNAAIGRGLVGEAEDYIILLNMEYPDLIRELEEREKRAIDRKAGQEFRGLDKEE